MPGSRPWHGRGSREPAVAAVGSAREGHRATPPTSPRGRHPHSRVPATMPIRHRRPLRVRPARRTSNVQDRLRPHRTAAGFVDRYRSRATRCSGCARRTFAGSRSLWTGAGPATARQTIGFGRPHRHAPRGTRAGACCRPRLARRAHLGGAEDPLEAPLSSRVATHAVDAPGTAKPSSPAVPAEPRALGDAPRASLSPILQFCIATAIGRYA